MVDKVCCSKYVYSLLAMLLSTFDPSVRFPSQRVTRNAAHMTNQNPDGQLIAYVKKSHKVVMKVQYIYHSTAIRWEEVLLMWMWAYNPELGVSQFKTCKQELNWRTAWLTFWEIQFVNLTEAYHVSMCSGPTAMIEIVRIYGCQIWSDTCWQPTSHWRLWRTQMKYLYTAEKSVQCQIFDYLQRSQWLIAL